MVSWILTISLVFSAVYLYLRWKLRRHHALAAKLNGPPDYPFIGASLMYAGKKMTDIIPIGFDNVTKYGKLFTGWFGPKLVLTTTEPSCVEAFLNSPAALEKGFMYKFLETDTGLVTASTETWKIHRKLLNPSFNLKILKSFIPIFNEKTIMLAEKMDQMAGKEPFFFYDQISRCTLDIICATTLGTNLNYQINVKEGDVIANALQEYLKLVSVRIFNIFHHLDIIYKLTSHFKEFTLNRGIADSLADKVIEIKKQKSQDDSASDKLMRETDGEDYRKPQIFIDQLFRLSKETTAFDDAAIKNEVFTMFATGYETTALSISHTVLLLAIHQDIQDKVVAELNEVYYDENELPDYDILSKLVYTEMVIKESLRFFPVAPLIVRETTGDVPLVSQGLVVPAGVLVVIPIFLVHRDPDFWGPDAHLFNPERFRSENVAKRHPCSFIPFSYGQRNCFGKTYAMWSMKIMLSNLLRKYKFNTTSTMDQIKEEFSITLKFDMEHLVSVERRKAKTL